MVENNHFYANRENAVDLKTCHRVVIRNNRMHQFRPSSTAKGNIYDSARGLSVSGNREGPMPSAIVIRRNRVHDITAVGGGEGTGIRLENSNGMVVVNNTVPRVKTALLFPAGAQLKKNGTLVGLEQFEAGTGDTSSTAGASELGGAFGPRLTAVDRGADVGLPLCGPGPDIGAVEMGC